LMMFLLENQLRQERLRDAIVDNLPALHEDVLQRADRLHANGLITPQGRDFYARAIDRIVAGECVYALVPHPTNLVA